MRVCTVTIATQADERKSNVVRNGRIEITSTKVTLAYTEETAETLLVFDKNNVAIERKGDYTMRLSMQKGETRNGVIGIGGNEGEVQTKTSRLAYTLSDTSFMLSLHYDLIIGGETQKMRIRLFAKIIG